MIEKINRRDFIKRASKLSLLGAGLLLSNSFLTSCAKHQIEKEEKKASKGRIFFSGKSLGYSFFIVQQEALQRAVEARGYEFFFEIANMNESKQFKQIETAVRKQPTAVICDPVASDLNFSSQLNSLVEQGIPVGIVDTPIENVNATITVAFDNYKAGELAAKKVVQLLINKHGEPKGSVLNCFADLKSEAWRLRKEGFENFIKKYKKVNLISKGTNGDITKMYDVTNEIIIKNPQLDAIHAPSETPARGIYEALIANKKLKPVGNPNHIIFVTIDGEPIAHKWIKEGILDVSISQDPIAYGEICAEIIIDYFLKNKQVPTNDYASNRYYWGHATFKMTKHGASLIIPPFTIDKKNVDEKRHWANIAYDEWGMKHL